MKKNDPTIKNELTFEDRIGMANYIVSGYFTDGVYTPYYADIHRIVAFFTYCVDGLEFEKDENIFVATASDEGLMYMYSIGTRPNSIISNDLNIVEGYVSDMLDYEKKKRLIESSEVLIKLKEILDKESRNKDEELRLTKRMEKLTEENERQLEANNKISELLTPEETASLLKKFNDPAFNVENITKAVSDSYMESMVRDLKNNELLQEKNDKIIELESHLEK